jgi:hypothetical protein
MSEKMDRDTFIHLIENYYGQYTRPAVREMVSESLKEFDQDRLPDLYRAILRYQPIKNGKPGVAEIENAYRLALKNGDCGTLRKRNTSSRPWRESMKLTEAEREENEKLFRRYGKEGLMGRVKFVHQKLKIEGKGRGEG